MPRPRLVRQHTPEQLRDRMTTQSALLALTKHPSWPVLIEEIEQKGERLEREAVVRAFSDAGLDREYQRYLRGFRDGMRYLAKTCAGAEDRLENILKQTKKESG